MEIEEEGAEDVRKSKLFYPFALMLIVSFTSILFTHANSIQADHENTHLLDVRSINDEKKSVTPGPERVEENPHGLFTTNTNTCSKCHSVHRGKAAALLTQQTQEQTCYLCHDGRGSKYDVKNGKFFDEETGMVVDSVSGGFNGFTSSHDIESSHPAPGGDGSQLLVVCTSCHNPHGSTNHRNLQTTVNGKSGIEVKASVQTSPLSHKEVVSYESGITSFCVSCHEDYSTYYQENPVNDNRHYRHPIETLLTGGKIRNESSSVPKALSFNPTLFTSLPTQGVPSGAYPNPESTVVNVNSLSASIQAGGNISSGDYYYAVTKKMKDGREAVVGYKMVLTVPEGSKVTLNWEADPSAVAYNVYRARKISDTSFTPISKVMVSTNAINFTDDGGKIGILSTKKEIDGFLKANNSYQYYIVAKTNGSVTHATEVVTVSLLAGESKITIDWDSLPNVDQYELYRADPDESGGQLPFRLLSTIQVKDENGNPLPMTDVFSDSGLVPLKTNAESMFISQNGSMNQGTYYYIVTAFNSLGESHQGYIKKIGVPSANSSVILQWDAINNAYGYKVYRAQSSTGEPDLSEYKLVASSDTQPQNFVYKEISNEGYLLFVDTNLSAGTASPPGINSQGPHTAKVVCTSCHYAHGTKKTDSNTGYSHLKRKNNSGVCQDCHKK